MLENGPMTVFAFSPLVFVQPGYEQADGDWSDESLAQIDLIRCLHPELAFWGRLAVGCAWGDYSQDIMAVGWLHPEQFGGTRVPEFLAYCYVRQLAPGFRFGGTGLYSEDIYQLAQQEPWLHGQHAAPAWTRN